MGAWGPEDHSLEGTGLGGEEWMSELGAMMEKGVVWEGHSTESDFSDQGGGSEMAWGVWRITGARSTCASTWEAEVRVWGPQTSGCGVTSGVLAPHGLWGARWPSVPTPPQPTAQLLQRGGGGPLTLLP